MVGIFEAILADAKNDPREGFFRSKFSAKNPKKTSHLIFHAFTARGQGFPGGHRQQPDICIGRLRPGNDNSVLGRVCWWPGGNAQGCRHQAGM